MSGNLKYALVAILFVILAISYNVSLYESISIGLFVYFLFDLFASIGKFYNLNALPIFLLILECLIGSSIVYNFYNSDSFIIAYQYDMALEKDKYFAYVLPATLAMILGMRLNIISIKRQAKIFQIAINEIKKYLSDKSNIGRYLIFFGVSAKILVSFVPVEFAYLFYLFSQLIIIGVFYIYFSKDKTKIYYIIGALLFLLIQSVLSGMFGDLVYSLILGGLLIILNFKINLLQKSIFVILISLFILIIQSIKGDYRQAAWYGKVNGDVKETFINLFLDRISSPEKLFEYEGFKYTIVRINQGMIVAKVINYIPSQKPYANGETIFNSVFATFVPRILWPDKPTAGGQSNMLRFTGALIEGYSINVGVIGESYGNFGKEGGIVFMFIYGLLFNLIFYLILMKAQSRPTILLWIPFIFINAIQAETDTLMTINSTIKNILFIALLFWFFNRVLRIKL